MALPSRAALGQGWATETPMNSTLVLALGALAALFPLAIAAWRRLDRNPVVFWLCTGVALAGVWTLIAAEARQGWPTGFAAAVWLSVGACVAVFAAAALLWREAHRLAPILVPYLIVCGAIAVAWASHAPHVLVAASASPWIVVHIAASLGTYALVMVAAAAGTAILVQERAIKRKARGPWSERLPSVAACEAIEIGLLAAGAVVLGAGIASGMAWSFVARRPMMPLDHKTVLSLLAFALILAILGLHYFTGWRGRSAARWVLVAGGALVLAYPGVKFVSEIVLGR